MPDELVALPTAAVGPVCVVCRQPSIVQWSRRSAGDPLSVEAVYACGAHAISLDAAAHVHQPDCPAPSVAVLPACGCVPEPLPGAVTPGGQDVVTLPTGWIVPAN